MAKAKAAAKPAQVGIERRRRKAQIKGSDGYSERRREIARVAADIFNKRGFRGTSLEEVAKVLGTDRASLYYYISSKRQLFDEVVREVSEGNVATAEAIEAELNVRPLEKLRKLIVTLMASYAQHYPLLYVYMRENLAHVETDRTIWSQYMRSINRRYEQVFIRIIQSGIDGGTIRPVSSARVIAFGVIGMIGWTNRWFVPEKSAESADEIGAAYAEMAIAGLRV